MPSHILIAVDGSDFALAAARYGLDLARSLGAEVTAVTVVPTWEAIGLSEIARGHFADEYAERARAYGDECLARVSDLARGAGIACATVQTTSDHPDRALLATAADRGCDLIVMGSHGRRGIESVVLGSVAQKVLAQSKVPVLVYRR